MRFALNAPNFGEYGDARVLAGLAREAEESGWDGFFVWDHIAWEGAANYADPWISLSDIAMETDGIRIGPMVNPLPRRRPWKVAHEAAMLDEGLDILAKMWSAEPFAHRGEHYEITEAQLTPPPAQLPRIPIWVAGNWPLKRPFARALRWDGYAPERANGSPLTPEDAREMRGLASERRGGDGPFDIRVSGSTAGECRDGARRKVARLAEARERVRLGPPDVG